MPVVGLRFGSKSNLSDDVQVFRPVAMAAMTDMMTEPPLATAEATPIMTRDTVVVMAAAAVMRPVVATPPMAPCRPAQAGTARMPHLPRSGAAPVPGCNRGDRCRTAALVATMRHPLLSLATRERRRWAVCDEPAQTQRGGGMEIESPT